jgi:hypothetical protein
MIRILRILEYIYDDDDRAEEDMACWKIPPMGSQRHGNMTIRSAIITDFNFEPPPPSSASESSSKYGIRPHNDSVDLAEKERTERMMPEKWMDRFRNG